MVVEVADVSFANFGLMLCDDFDKNTKCTLHKKSV